MVQMEENISIRELSVPFSNIAYASFNGWKSRI